MTMRTRSKAFNPGSTTNLPIKWSFLEKQYLEDELKPKNEGLPDYLTGKNIWIHKWIIKKSSWGHWTREEDKLLEEAVWKYKGKSWKKIATMLKGWTDVQCLHWW